ncbi:MAG: histidine kinase [Actinomycetota bacterium]|nr:histidine kinase [Actinomycetota bacterium]
MTDVGEGPSTDVSASKNRILLRGRDSLINRLLPSVWLAFLLLPLLAMWAKRGPTLTHDVVVTVVIAAFCGVFVYSSAVAYQGRERWSRRHDMVVVGILLAIPLALVFYDRSGYWAYGFVYALLPAMRLWRQPIQYRLVLALGALTGLAALAGGLSGAELIIPIGVVLGSGAGWLGFGRLIEANAALERAQEEKAQVAVSEERLRFARDLHDLLGHSLSVITLKSELAGRLLAVDADRAGTEVAEIELVARRALKEVREAVSGYRQSTVAVELAGARTALAAARISWSEEVDPDVVLPEALEAVLAWTVREGVTNVIRHSQAATCTLTLVVDDATVTMSIIDDGVGGDGSGGGNGLRGLGERVASVAGTLEAGPGDDGGYRLVVLAPRRIEQPAPRAAETPPSPQPQMRADQAQARHQPAPAGGPEDRGPAGGGPIGRMLAAARGHSTE